MQNGKNISRVTAVVCESDLGLFLAAPVIQCTVDFCDHKTRIQLPTAEILINRIAEIIGRYILHSRWRSYTESKYSFSTI